MIAQVAVPAQAAPEVRLLLGCARTHVDSAIAEQIKSLLQRQIDWSYVMRIALRHRLGALLYWNLNAICPGAVPGPVLSQMRRQFYASVRHSQILTDELLGLLDLLHTHGIEALPLKGPALAAALYHNPALRLSSDLDILVHRRELAPAIALLRSRGYSQIFKLGRIWETISLPFRHAYGFVDATGTLNVDLHWGISQSYFACRLDTEQLWTQLAPVSLNGKAILSLGPEQLLMLLCMHGARHTWTRLAWICDVAELVLAYPQLPWHTIMRQAHDLRSSRMLLLALCLAHSLLGVGLPEAIAARIEADLVVCTLAEQVTHRLFEEHQRWTQFQQALFYLHIREDWRDRLQYGPELLRIALSLPAERIRMAGASIGRK
jgi:hypothetical protein